MSGETTRRGYGWDWQKLRKQWAAAVANGNGWCTAPVCMHTTRWIPPDSLWDGGHDEHRQPRGPEHRWCNRAAAARKAARTRHRRRHPMSPFDTSRIW